LQMSCVATILGGDPAGGSFWPIAARHNVEYQRS
jgi:hypothetical protein